MPPSNPQGLVIKTQVRCHLCEGREYLPTYTYERETGAEITMPCPNPECDGGYEEVEEEPCGCCGGVLGDQCTCAGGIFCLICHHCRNHCLCLAEDDGRYAAADDKWTSQYEES